MAPPLGPHLPRPPRANPYRPLASPFRERGFARTQHQSSGLAQARPMTVDFPYFSPDRTRQKKTKAAENPQLLSFWIGLVDTNTYRL